MEIRTQSSVIFVGPYDSLGSVNTKTVLKSFNNGK